MNWAGTTMVGCRSLGLLDREGCRWTWYGGWKNQNSQEKHKWKEKTYVLRITKISILWNSLSIVIIESAFELYGGDEWMHRIHGNSQTSKKLVLWSCSIYVYMVTYTHISENIVAIWNCSYQLIFTKFCDVICRRARKRRLSSRTVTLRLATSRRCYGGHFSWHSGSIILLEGKMSVQISWQVN